jgi:hypothetical protein
MVSRTFYSRRNSDIIGALASSLCLVHCIATPFLFIAQTASAHHHHAPMWWKSIDFVFLVISFFAVHWSVKTTSKMWIKWAFWLTWAFLTLVILNEKLELFHLAEELIYIPALGLVGLHIYNRKYYQCKDEKCGLS